MKRGTPRHPKVYDLMQELGLPVRSRAVVIGYLELLWHFTAEFAPQGDIGKYSDDRIEGAMDWGGKPGKLVAALTNTKWCDAHTIHRLIVHDWHDHADDAIRKRLARSGLPFLSVADKVTGHRQTWCANPGDEICLPEPRPEPVPVPEPNTNTTPTFVGGSKVPAVRKRRVGNRTTPEVEKALGDRLVWFNRCWEAYPCKDGKLEGMDAFERKVKTHELAATIYRGIQRYGEKLRADPTIKPKYMQGWINRERWTDESVPQVPSVNGNRPTAASATEQRRAETLAVLDVIDKIKGRA